MSFIHRGAVGLALSTLVVAGLVPAAQADNLDADTLVAGVASFGDVCRGTTASSGVPFTLRRTGNVNQSWGNSALVTVAPTSQPSPLTLGSTSGTTTTGWVTGLNNVEVTAGSAAASVSVPANATLGVRTASVTYQATGAGAAGGTATTTRDRAVTFSWNVVDCTPADTTAPVISKVVTPAMPDGANGWYRTNIAVDWSVTDPESAATPQGCADTALTTDGSLTSSCSATSAGGTAGPVSVTVKRDATPPLLEPSVSGDVGDNGWYDGDVTVSWLASDATSQIDPATLCAPASLTEDATSRTFECTVRDLAGNSTWASVTVQRDATDPVIVSTVAGTLGGEDWYTSDVEVSWEVSDATSSLASTAGCDAVTLEHDSAGQSYTCTATDNAGNSSSSTVDVKRDATAPDILFTKDGLEGDNGWYRGSVTVDWTVFDGLSGLGPVLGCVDRTVTADGRHALDCTATDVAGNTAEAAAQIDKDATAPVVTAALIGDEGDNGWYVDDVHVGWTVTEATAGLAGEPECDAADVTEDTAGTSFTCTATDLAGNTGSDTVTVKRDATPPTVDPKVVGTLGTNGWYVGDVTIGWALADATSGVEQGEECLDATLEVDTLTQHYTCAVTDRAGNVAEGEIDVKRDANKPTIASSVRGTVGFDGWFTGDVEVSWTVDDATSGVLSKSGCDTSTLGTDSAGTTYTCSARDNAGNHHSDSVTVKRDATDPAISYELDGPAGDNGWYVGPVDVDWTIVEEGSGVAGAVNCEDVQISADGEHSETCIVTDRAGNDAEATALVEVDATDPTVTPSVVGRLGANGWYTDNVIVGWNTSDATSGPDATRTTGCTATTLSTDTTGVDFTCVVTDLAGNQRTASVTVKRDAAAPLLTLTGGPADGATYSFGDVPAPSTCTATDPTSGLAGPCIVVAGATAVGPGTQVSTVADQAGNTARDERTYTVAAWTLDGFYRPVVMGSTVVNTVKAGSTVPLKFNVLKGTTPMTAGIGAKFTAAKSGCEGSDAEDPVEFVTTGATSLRYDEVGRQWVQNWATPAAGKGFCYRVTMTTADGSSITADFKLK